MLYGGGGGSSSAEVMPAEYAYMNGNASFYNYFPGDEQFHLAADGSGAATTSHAHYSHYPQQQPNNQQQQQHQANVVNFIPPVVVNQANPSETGPFACNPTGTEDCFDKNSDSAVSSMSSDRVHSFSDNVIFLVLLEYSFDLKSIVYRTGRRQPRTRLRSARAISPIIIAARAKPRPRRNIACLVRTRRRRVRLRPVSTRPASTTPRPRSIRITTFTRAARVSMPLGSRRAITPSRTITPTPSHHRRHRWWTLAVDNTTIWHHRRNTTTEIGLCTMATTMLVSVVVLPIIPWSRRRMIIRCSSPWASARLAVAPTRSHIIIAMVAAAAPAAAAARFAIHISTETRNEPVLSRFRSRPWTLSTCPSMSSTNASPSTS